jgi:hypothetical protein
MKAIEKRKEEKNFHLFLFGKNVKLSGQLHFVCLFFSSKA